MDVQLPDKLFPLFSPKRYKILYGGRDGVKSWSIARALLALGAERPLRILCARETQQSIQESVHQLLSEQIKRLGLEYHYRVMDYKIRGTGQQNQGTEFLFYGLGNLTVSQLKSFESIDILWVEEAQSVKRNSWQTIIPTIRKAGSEIWVSFNPDLETDDTYIRFVLNPPPGAWVCRTSWRDNAWLSEESQHEIDLLYQRDPETAAHVYDGATRSTVEGAIYKSEITKAEGDGRITDVPYDPSLPVRTFWDLGWSDLVAIWFVQFDTFKLRVIDYEEDRYHDTDYYLQMLQRKGYTYSMDQSKAALVWPWDAASKMARNTMQQSIRAKGYTLRILESQSKIDGIDAVRRLFPRLWFDKTKCADGINALRRYQWGPNTQLGQMRREPLHDAASHPADALRTMAMAMKPEKPQKDDSRSQRAAISSAWA